MVRWFLVGTGPLMRRSDRVESAFRLLLLGALLVAVPVALLVGSAVRHGQLRLAAQQAESRHAVHAVVLADPDVPDGAGPDTFVQTPVGWTTAHGTRKTATVPVPVTDRADDRVVVWLTPAGQVTGPPLDPREAADNAVVGGILAGVGVLLVAWALLGLSRLALNARRSRQWQVDWQAVEPLWTSRER